MFDNLLHTLKLQINGDFVRIKADVPIASWLALIFGIVNPILGLFRPADYLSQGRLG
jgi:hypothetical protein